MIQIHNNYFETELNLFESLNIRKRINKWQKIYIYFESRIILEEEEFELLTRRTMDLLGSLCSNFQLIWPVNSGALIYSVGKSVGNKLIKFPYCKDMNYNGFN